MPQFITLPTVTPTGYGQLGQVIMGAASDYAAEKRRSDDEQRIRANQLEDAARKRTEQLGDVQSIRNYSDQRYNIERGDKLKDTEAEKLFAAKTEMMRLGYLKPADFDNDAAVQAALTKMHGDGMLTKYQGALSSGDLTYADLQAGDESKISAGLAKYSARLGKETTRVETSISDAQATANSLQAQYDQTLAQASKLDQDLSRPVEDTLTSPDQNEIRNLALQLAQQTSGGKPPSQKEIAAQLPVAQQQLQQQHLEAAVARKQQTQERVRLLKDQAQTLGVRLNTLAARNIFPSSKPGAQPNALIEPDSFPSGPSLAPAGARQAALQATIAGARTPGAALGAPPPAAANPALPSDLRPLPGNDPLISAENQRRTVGAQQQAAAEWQKRLADPFNDTANNLSDIDHEIAVLRAPYKGQGVPFSPAQRAQRLSELLVARDAAAKLLESQRRSMFNLDASSPSATTGVRPAAQSNTSEATPAAAFASPTSLFPSFSQPLSWWSTGQQAAGF